MNTPQTFIHIGLQKTASTFLQKEFFPKINGITYLGPSFTQENLVFNQLQYADDTIYNPSNIGTEIEDILNKSVSQEKLLISDELLTGYAFYNFVNRGTIANRLAEYSNTAEIILFLRDQTDLILSLYNQYVKIGWVATKLDENFLSSHGTGISFEDWKNGVKGNLSNRFINHRSVMSVGYFNYSKLIKYYEDRFKKVHVFLYEDFKKDQNATLVRLSEILGVEMPMLKPDAVNKSVGTGKLKSKLVQNRLRLFLDKKSWAYKIIKTLILPFTGNYTPDRHWIDQQLKDAGIFEDNKSINEQYGLGMERFPGKYLL